MKKILLIIIFVFCFQYTAFSQGSNSLQVSPFNFTNVPLGVFYQRAFNNYFGLESSISFSFENTVFRYYDYDQATQTEIVPGFFRTEPLLVQTIKQTYEFGTGIGFTYRPFGHRIKGWYISLTQQLNVVIYDNTKNTKIFIPTEIQSGYQWVFPHGVTLSFGFGLVKVNQLSDNIVKIDGREYELAERGKELYNFFSPRIRFGIGYSW